VLTGDEVLLSRGPLVDAVLASAAIPGVLPAIEWEGRPLVDGGVVDNTPISQAIALGARRVYVLPTGAPCALSAPPRGALAMLVAQAEAGARGFLRGHAGTVVPLRGQAA
jgi:NTE family protein